MKNALLRRLAPATLLLCLSLTWFACQKETTLAPAEATTTHKDITLYDPNGLNSAVIRVSSESTELLDAQDWSKVIELTALTETPATGAFNEPSESTEAPRNLPEVRFEIVSQHLQEGAKGISLRFSDPSDAAADRWQWVNTFTTSYDNIKVKVNYGCHDVYYYKRPYSYSSFSLMAAFFNRCTAGSWTTAYSIPSYQMQSKTYYNNGTSFTITAW